MPPNILLVVLDSVRAANTSLHGHYNSTTPFLEELSEEAVKYENAKAPATSSRPSHASMFTGLHPPEHDISGDYRLRPGTTVWETLAQTYGYATAYFTENPNVRAGYGFTDGFETAVTRSAELPFPDGDDPRDISAQNSVELAKQVFSSDASMKMLLNGLSLVADKYPQLPLPVRFAPNRDIYTDTLLDWIDQQSDNWAAFVNLMDAHTPYRPGEFNNWASERTRRHHLNWTDDDRSTREILDEDNAWGELASFEALYDGAIRRADAKVERIVSHLKNIDEFEDTLVVITSDHGETFGEPSQLYPNHRLVGHTHAAHEHLIHVPLVVSPPETASMGDTVITEPASLTEFPNVVEATVAGNRASFVPDDEVIAATFGSGRPRDVVGEPDGAIEGHVRVVYEAAEDHVNKYVSWGDTSATIEIHGPKDRSVVVTTDQGVTERVFDDVKLQEDVRMRSNGVAATVKEHLEDLGYAD